MTKSNGSTERESEAKRKRDELVWWLSSLRPRDYKTPAVQDGLDRLARALRGIDASDKQILVTLFVALEFVSRQPERARARWAARIPDSLREYGPRGTQITPTVIASLREIWKPGRGEARANKDAAIAKALRAAGYHVHPTTVQSYRKLARQKLGT